MIDPSNVTACLVTRGDCDLTPILATLPYRHVIVYNNARRMDLKVYGRYAAARVAQTPVVYTQDDDVIFRDHDGLCAEYEPGVMVCNWAHGDWTAGFDDVGLVGAGAIFDRDLWKDAFKAYWANFPADEESMYEADFIVGTLTPHRHVHLPYEILPRAREAHRLCNQPWQTEAKMRVTNRSRYLKHGRVIE